MQGLFKLAPHLNTESELPWRRQGEEIDAPDIGLRQVAATKSLQLRVDIIVVRERHHVAHAEEEGDVLAEIAMRQSVGSVDLTNLKKGCILYKDIRGGEE